MFLFFKNQSYFYTHKNTPLYGQYKKMLDYIIKILTISIFIILRLTEKVLFYQQIENPPTSLKSRGPNKQILSLPNVGQSSTCTKQATKGAHQNVKKANLTSSCSAYEGPQQQGYFCKSLLNIHLLTYNKKYIPKIRNACFRVLQTSQCTKNASHL